MHEATGMRGGQTGERSAPGWYVIGARGHWYGPFTWPQLMRVGRFAGWFVPCSGIRVERLPRRAGDRRFARCHTRKMRGGLNVTTWQPQIFRHGTWYPVGPFS